MASTHRNPTNIRVKVEPSAVIRSSIDSDDADDDGSDSDVVEVAAPHPKKPAQIIELLDDDSDGDDQTQLGPMPSAVAITASRWARGGTGLHLSAELKWFLHAVSSMDRTAEFHQMLRHLEHSQDPRSQLVHLRHTLNTAQDIGPKLVDIFDRLFCNPPIIKPGTAAGTAGIVSAIRAVATRAAPMSAAPAGHDEAGVYCRSTGAGVGANIDGNSAVGLTTEMGCVNVTNQPTLGFGNYPYMHPQMATRTGLGMGTMGGNHLSQIEPVVSLTGVGIECSAPFAAYDQPGLTQQIGLTTMPSVYSQQYVQ